MNEANRDYPLVQRCLNQDSRAFNELINRYKRQIFSLIYRVVQNHTDAEDLAQDTFIKAYKNLASYNPQYPFITWLFKIAHNTAIDFLRTRKPNAVSIHDEEAGIDIEDDGIPMEELHQARSQGEQLERVMASLPSSYREVLVLRHQQELSYEEISQSLDIPIGTVKTRLFRARDLMKEKLLALGYAP